MTIPIATPSEVSKWIFHISSQIKQATFDQALACSTGIEAAFYTCLKPNDAPLSPNSPDSSRLVHFFRETVLARIHSSKKFIRETAVTRIHEIQILFNMVNTGASLLCLKKLDTEIEKKYSFSIISVASVKRAFPFFALAGITYFIGKFIFNRYYKSPPAPPVEGRVTISTKMRFQQKIARNLHVIQLVLNTALVCFAQNRFWLVFSVIGSSYNFYKNSQLKWLTFSRRFNFLLGWQQPRVRSSLITYNMLALPPNTPSAEDCSICSDENAGPASCKNHVSTCSICMDEIADTAFCINHVFCQTCLSTIIANKSDYFDNDTAYVRTTTRHYRNGVHERTSYAYKVSIPQENLPSCPTCRGFPLQNDCEVNVEDVDQGNFKAKVNIIRPDSSKQPLFEKLYAAYNIAQAGFAFLQKYPELAATIFKIQEVFVAVDIAGLVFTVYFLHNRIKETLRERFGTIKIEIMSAVSLVALAGLSYLAMLGINSYLKPAFVLKDILGNLQVSPEILKGIKISWDSPFIHQVVQCLYINRIVASFALAFFSENPILNIVSALSQSFSLFRISILRWIKFVQVLESPLKKVVDTGGYLFSSLNQESVKSLTINSEFITYPSCSNESSHLQSTVKSIYEYISKLLDKSTWDRYWLITRNQYGLETGRSLKYAVYLKNSPLQPCTCTLEPSLINIGMKAVDTYVGNANVNIWDQS